MHHGQKFTELIKRILPDKHRPGANSYWTISNMKSPLMSPCQITTKSTQNKNDNNEMLPQSIVEGKLLGYN